jgi:hypothetical protein
MKKTIIALLITTGMSLFYLALYGLMNIPEIYDAFCRFFGAVGTVSTLCSPREALVHIALFFAICFTVLRVGSIIDIVLDEMKEEKKMKLMSKEQGTSEDERR